MTNERKMRYRQFHATTNFATKRIFFSHILEIFMIVMDLTAAL